jgi:hypothetical protein
MPRCVPLICLSDLEENMVVVRGGCEMEAKW